MPIIKIDNKEYDLDSLPQEAKVHLQSLQFVDAEIAQLTSKVAVFKTARNTYAKALNEALPPPVTLADPQLAGDTFKLS